VSPSFLSFLFSVHSTVPFFLVLPPVHVVSTVVRGQVGRNPLTTSCTSVVRDYSIRMYPLATTTRIWHGMHFLQRHQEIIVQKRK